MTPDKKTLDLAREWAEWADKKLGIAESHLHARAAADLISSLPDAWVDVEDLRNWINFNRGKGLWSDSEVFKARRGLLNDLEDMLPAPPAPRTMDEIEWDDEEHHLAEATAAWAEGTTSEVVMLHRHGVTIAVHQSAPHYTGLRQLNPAILTPTGRKYRLEPADDVASATGGELTTQDVVDECRAVRKERAAAEFASPRPEDVPEGETWLISPYENADPAPAFRVHASKYGPGKRWAYFRVGGSMIGFADDEDVTLVARLVPETTEFGPYARITKENDHDQ